MTNRGLHSNTWQLQRPPAYLATWPAHSLFSMLIFLCDIRNSRCLSNLQLYWLEQHSAPQALWHAELRETCKPSQRSVWNRQFEDVTKLPLCCPACTLLLLTPVNYILIMKTLTVYRRFLSLVHFWDLSHFFYITKYNIYIILHPQYYYRK